MRNLVTVSKGARIVLNGEMIRRIRSGVNMMGQLFYDRVSVFSGICLRSSSHLPFYYQDHTGGISQAQAVEEVPPEEKSSKPTENLKVCLEN